jgi:hypothetical protein
VTVAGQGVYCKYVFNLPAITVISRKYRDVSPASSHRQHSTLPPDIVLFLSSLRFPLSFYLHCSSVRRRGFLREWRFAFTIKRGNSPLERPIKYFCAGKNLPRAFPIKSFNRLSRARALLLLRRIHRRVNNAIYEFRPVVGGCVVRTDGFAAPEARAAS